jgi:hypothetical protein
MRYWITPDGSYYEGENVAEGSIEVPQRPSPYHALINQQWQYSAELKRASLKPLQARQVRLILSQYGFRDAVEMGIAQASQSVKDEWNFANEFERTSPTLNGMAQLLGLTAEQVDLMFEEGVLL